MVGSPAVRIFAILAFFSVIGPLWRQLRSCAMALLHFEKLYVDCGQQPSVSGDRWLESTRSGLIKGTANAEIFLRKEMEMTPKPKPEESSVLEEGGGLHLTVIEGGLKVYPKSDPDAWSTPWYLKGTTRDPENPWILIFPVGHPRYPKGYRMRDPGLFNGA